MAENASSDHWHVPMVNIVFVFVFGFQPIYFVYLSLLFPDHLSRTVLDIESIHFPIVPQRLVATIPTIFGRSSAVPVLIKTRLSKVLL